MPRRIELPDEFVLRDGTRVLTPADLAARIEAEPHRAPEIWERLADGDLVRWLRQSGWEALAQRVERFGNQSAGEGLPAFLQILREDSRVDGAPQPSSIQGRVPFSPAASSLRSAEGQAPRRRRPPGGPSPGEAQPNRIEQHVECALLIRQVEALRAFGVAETARREAERVQNQQMESTEAALRGRAQEAQVPAEAQRQRINEVVTASRALLDKVKLAVEWPLVTAGGEEFRGEPQQELERSAANASNALIALREAVDALEERRSKPWWRTWAKWTIRAAVLAASAWIAVVLLVILVGPSLRSGDQHFYLGGQRILGYDPQKSPDGKHVSFRARPLIRDPVYGDYGPTHIWVVNADGSNQVRLTHKGGSYAWSPTGNKIAFLVDPLGSSELHIADATGRSRIVIALRKLPAMKSVRELGTTVKPAASGLAWSPDGNELGFRVRGGPLSGTVCIMNSDGTEIREVSSSSWYPSGRTEGSPRMLQRLSAKPTPAVSPGPPTEGNSQEIRATPMLGHGQTAVQAASLEEIMKGAEAKLERGDYDGALKDAELAVNIAPGDRRTTALLERVRRIRSILR